MPRVTVPLAGPSNVLRSLNADCERTINLYAESTAPGNSKVPLYLVGTPGLRPFAQVNDSPGNFLFYQDGRAFAIVGTTFAELFADQTTRARGTVAAPTPMLPATIVSNGSAGGQLLIVSGGRGYVFSLTTSSFLEINDANFSGTGFPTNQALMCEFMDGYGIVLQANSRKFFISTLEDFTGWDAGDVGERSEGSDNFAAVIRNHRELWFLGTKTGEVWFNSGDTFPFTPVPGVFLETGATTNSTTRVGGGIAWIEIDERGHGMIMAADGYTPTRISTHAVELALQASADLNAVHLFTQQQQGHTFVWVYVPDLQTTWVYDQATQLWAERGLWDPDAAVYRPFPVIDHEFAFGRHLVVANDSGFIYELDLSVFDDSVEAV